jgi:hypothetical protein
VSLGIDPKLRRDIAPKLGGEFPPYRKRAPAEAECLHNPPQLARLADGSLKGFCYQHVVVGLGALA